MWISREKYEELQDDIENLSEQVSRIQAHLDKESVDINDIFDVKETKRIEEARKLGVLGWPTGETIDRVVTDRTYTLRPECFPKGIEIDLAVKKAKKPTKKATKKKTTKK